MYPFVYPIVFVLTSSYKCSNITESKQLFSKKRAKTSNEKKGPNRKKQCSQLNPIAQFFKSVITV